MALQLDAEERSGDQVLVAENVRSSVDDRTLLRDFDARLMRGDVVGLVGPNGAGKSTLLRAISGERPVEGGALRVPESARIAHYRQDLAQVPSDMTLYDIIAALRPHWGRGPIQGHVGRFGFSGDSVLRRAGTLSGGERARIALAMMMLSGANVLLFDEPTNHLDVESIEALEDAIEAYDGTVVLVSHDRALLRGLTTRMWILHDARITDYPGSFEEWEAASRERAHAAAVATAEAEALRKVKGRKQTHRPDDERQRKATVRRTAERAVTEAERAVSDWEARVATLREQLEDPHLYLTAEGAKRAVDLGKELEVARGRLDEAFGRWETATREPRRQRNSLALPACSAAPRGRRPSDAAATRQ